MSNNDLSPTTGSHPLLVSATARIVMVVAVSLSLYQLYTAGIAPLTALVQRSIHLGAILVLTFLLKPPFAWARKDRLNGWVIFDWLLAAIAIYCTAYICFNLTAIFERQGDWLPADRVVSIIGTLLVLEACRRVIGVIMTGICVVAMLYAHFGPWMPELIIHKGYSVERIATTPVADHRRNLRPAHWRGGHFCFRIRSFRRLSGIDRRGQLFHRTGLRPYRSFFRRSGQNFGGGLGIHGLGVRIGGGQCGGHGILYHSHDEKGRLPAPRGRGLSRRPPPPAVSSCRPSWVPAPF